MEKEKSDEFHIMMLFLNFIEFRFWVKVLISRFILEVAFSYDW